MPKFSKTLPKSDTRIRGDVSDPVKSVENLPLIVDLTTLLLLYSYTFSFIYTEN